MSKHDEICLSDLPPSLREMQTVIGLPATLALVELAGGTRIRVPTEFDPDHVFARALGHEPLTRLIGAYAGIELYIPRALTALLALRNMDIIKRLELESAPKLAREYGMSERHIFNIANRPEAARVPHPEQHQLPLK